MAALFSLKRLSARMLQAQRRPRVATKTMSPEKLMAWVAALGADEPGSAAAPVGRDSVSIFCRKF